MNVLSVERCGWIFVNGVTKDNGLLAILFALLKRWNETWGCLFVTIGASAEFFNLSAEDLQHIITDEIVVEKENIFRKEQFGHT